VLEAPVRRRGLLPWKQIISAIHHGRNNHYFYFVHVMEVPYVGTSNALVYGIIILSMNEANLFASYHSCQPAEMCVPHIHTRLCIDFETLGQEQQKTKTSPVLSSLIPPDSVPVLHLKLKLMFFNIYLYLLTYQQKSSFLYTWIFLNCTFCLINFEFVDKRCSSRNIIFSKV